MEKEGASVEHPRKKVRGKKEMVNTADVLRMEEMRKVSCRRK